MEKIDVLKKTSAGSSVAEKEAEGLKNYFLKTFLWERIINDEIDIIHGCKGSGKSALYNHLPNYSDTLFESDILFANAENPRGALAFKDLQTSPPTEEAEFISIWKLYFIMIITQKLTEYNYNDGDFKEVTQKLQDSDLMPRTFSFSAILKMVRDYVNKVKPSLEPFVKLNEHSGSIDRVGVKISLNEPSTKLADKGVVSVNHLYELLNKSLNSNKNKFWIAIDRLDAVFDENLELETNALRSLFKVYIELFAFDKIRLIIFLRDDIWNRIIEKGFRETSHITKTEIIKWDENSLFHLLLTRLINNEELLKHLSMSREELNDKSKQLILFHRIFSQDISKAGMGNFNWMVSRIKDGNGNSSPRELIELVNLAIKHQIIYFTEGIDNAGKGLVSSDAINLALTDTSKNKLNTFIAEYPLLKNWVNRLKNNKFKNKKVRKLTIAHLMDYWECNEKQAKVIIGNLLKYGFFINESDNERGENLLLGIPYIYRYALGFPVN